ncbi:hypothetical protein APHAL10511_006336 [Amanita phalloides]|nr:hypothetical protein APHAL10511_006336 [Amanita phalloides]
MFIPRDNENCQSSLSCNSENTDPIQQNSSTNSNGGSGPQRYIGVSMVAGALFLVLVLWLWIAEWQRWQCWGRKRPSSARENSKNKLVDLSMTPDLEKPKRVHMKDAKGCSREELESKSERVLGYSKRPQVHAQINFNEADKEQRIVD